MMTTNLFVIANVKQLPTGGNFRILLPFLRTSWGVGVLNSAVFNNFSQSGWVWHDFGGPSEFRGGVGWNPPPLVRHWSEEPSEYCHAVPTSGLFVNYTSSDSFVKCWPGRCDRFPTTRLLVNIHHLTFRMMRIVSTKVTCLVTRYAGVMGTRKHVWTW